MLTFKFLQRVSCIFLVGNFLVFFLLELLYSMSFCLSFTCLVMGYFFMGWRHLEKACCDGKIKLLVTHKSFSPFKFLQRVSCFFSCWKFSCIVLVGIIVFNVLLFKFYLFCDGLFFHGMKTFGKCMLWWQNQVACHAQKFFLHHVNTSARSTNSVVSSFQWTQTGFTCIS